MTHREMVREVGSSVTEAAYQLSPLQAGLLAHHLWDPRSGVDIEQLVCTLPEALDVPALQQAWADVATHHEVLRTGFRWEGVPEPIQEIHPLTVIPFQELDWGGHSAECQQAFLESFLAEDRRAGFDLASPPLLRLTLIRTGAAASTLIWTFHHILLDGRAFPVIMREVFARYEALRRGERPDFPTPAPFRDYVDWVAAQDWTRSEPFWRSTLAGVTAPTPLPVPFPPDPAAADPGAAGACVFTIDRETTRQLHLLAEQHRFSLGTLVQAAWALLLSRYSRESDVVFGVTRTTRHASVAGAQDMVGLLINTVPLRVRAQGDEALIAWLEGVRDRWRGLRDHEHTPLRSIQAWSEQPPGTQLFDTLVVYEQYLLDDVLRDTGPEWKDRSFRLHEKTNYALTMAAYGGAALTLKLGFDPRKVTEAQARRLLGHMQVLLSGMPAHGDRPIGDLAMLSPAEQQAEDRWNETSSPLGIRASVAELICQAAVRTPDQPAVVSGPVTLSWGELMARASRLAHALQAQGVGPDVLVGLCLERSADLITGMLGILLAGGAFVPLLPGDPAARREQQVGESGLRLVVSDRAHRGLLPPDVAVTCIDDPAMASLPDTPPFAAATLDSLAYILFTSGSTGTPKGVAITHANLLHYIRATADLLGLPLSGAAEPWHCATVSSLAADLGHTSVFLALCSGGVLHVVPDELVLDAVGYKAWIARRPIDLLKITPSHFQALTGPEFAPEHLPRKWLVVGGEALTWSLVDRVLAAGRCRILNEYGPTETTVGVVVFEAGSKDVSIWAPATVPIGHPLPNTTAHVLDARQRPVPVGVPGELWIGGLGVARGYLGRDELTRERFVTLDGERRYRTGDQVRRLPTGDLEFLGRFDNQVKIRGYRVELGEIETVLAGHPDVAVCAVSAPVDPSGSRQILAFVLPSRDSIGLADRLRAYAKKHLPAHMVPSRITPLASLPLTPSGKVDLRALPIPVPETGSLARAHVSPRTPREEALAQLWADVLRLERVGVLDNYFDLGGDSILSIRIASRARQAGMPVTVAMIAEHPTVSQLAAAIGDAQEAAGSDNLPATGTAPLTPIQRWFFELDPAARNHWNQTFLFQTGEGLDERALRGAIEELLRHHDALRLRFRCDAGVWQQRFEAPSEVPLWVEDFSAIEDSSLTAELSRITSRAATSLHIEEGPCLRAVYLRFGRGRGGRLLMAVHHLVVDGVSWSILLEDLERAYLRISLGQLATLPHRTTSYQRWAELLASTAVSDQLAGELSYWRHVTREPLLPLPIDGPREGGNTVGEATTVRVSLNERETDDLLQRVPAAYGTQVNDVLLTALEEAMAPWVGRGACLIDLEGHGREEIANGLDLSRTVGWFTSIFPVRLELDGSGDVGDRLKAMKERLRAIPRRGVGYGILRYLADEGKLDSRPQAEVLFNYLGQLDQLVAGSTLFSFATEDEGPWLSPQGRRKYLLEVNAMVLRGRLEFRWTFGRGIHDETTVRRVAEGLTGALRDLIRHCLAGGARGRSPADFPLVSLTQQEVDRLGADGWDIEEIAPLVPMQSLFLAIGGGGDDLGFEQWLFELRGALVADTLRQAWQLVTQRHAILRAGFIARGGLPPVQVIRSRAETPFTVLDWRNLTEEEQAVLLRDFREDDRKKGFRVDAPPLHRVALIQTGDSAWALMWSYHHLILDRWSWPIVLREVGAVYQALRAGRPIELPQAVPWTRYLAWLRGRDVATTERFWREELAGVVPASFPRLADAGEAGGERALVLSPDDTDRLAAVAREHQVTLNSLVALAWAVWLTRRTSTFDVVFGLAVAGRPEEIVGIEDLVGMCINNIPLRVNLDPAMSVAKLLERLSNRQASVRKHEYAALTDLQLWSGLPWHQRLFDTLLIFQESGADITASESFGDTITVRTTPVATQTNYPLALVVRGGDALQLRLVYQGRSAGAESAQHALEEVQQLLLRLPALMEKPVQQLLDMMPIADELGTAREEALVQAAARGSPQNTLEVVLIQIWEGLFPGRTIDPSDDFFALGGHSMLAVRMVDEIDKAIGITLPLALLFRGASVRDIAGYLMQSMPFDDRPELIEVQAGRPGVTPFFMVHGDMTAAGYYCRQLAEAAGPDQPFYGIPPYVPQGPDTALTFQSMAARHEAAVRRVQPRGPYRLGGYCAGGLVAYELARRLRAEGEQVELVLLVDSSPTNLRHRLVHMLITAVSYLTQRTPEERADRFAYLMGRVWDVRQLPRVQRLRHYLGIPARGLRRIFRRTDPVPPPPQDPVDAPEQSALSELMNHYERAALLYLPGRYDGRLDVLLATDGAPVPDLGWDRVAREVELITTPDSHATVVTKALPGVFAAALARLQSGVGG